MKTMKLLLILVLLVSGLTGTAAADIYRWIDDSGTLHYTGDPDNVPAAYRTRVETLAVRQSTRTPAETPQEHVIPFVREREGVIFVDVLLNDGVKARMVLDTGASLVVISEELARKLGRDAATGGDRIILKTAGGDIEGRSAVIDRIELGAAVRERVRAVVNGHADVFKGFDGLLGSSFLDGYKVTIDYSNSQIHMKEP